MNKLLTNTDTVDSRALVDGRAIQVTWKWHRDKPLTILAVYAPTVQAENREFWKKLKTKIKRIPGPNRRASVLLGDFNFVEDALDRFPNKVSRIDAPETFANLKRYLRVHDGWRKSNVTKIEWTWRNADRSAMSRIDRIYVTEELLMASREWDISISNLTTNDHSRIGMEIVNLDAPETGPGRWAMPASIIKDRQFMEGVEKIGKEAFGDMRRIEQGQRSDADNVQVVWKRFKDGIAGMAR
ncbi:hypothetical protein AURDEDRAFT_69493, partial [Auricularia subglabra TFB-10046 SS5]